MLLRIENTSPNIVLKLKLMKIPKKEYNEVNASYFNKHAAKKKNELGTDVYNKKRADYMKEYREINK